MIFGRNRNARFISEKDHRNNLKLQRSMTPETLTDLYGYGIDENTSLELEFFFYTDTMEKARALESALRELDYSAESSEHDYDDEKLITGRTTPLQMRTDILTDWTARMCELGFRHDCEFDGWGAATGE